MQTTTTVTVDDASGEVRAAGPQYGFVWSPADDEFRLLDGQGRTVVSGPMQPAVVIRRPGAAHPTWSPGRPDQVTATGDTLQITYAGVNGEGALTMRWRFESGRCWLEPVTYTQPDDAAVVSLYYFALPPSEVPELPNPGLLCRYLVHPGINGAGVLSPVIITIANLDTISWLGRGGPATIGPDRGLMRQQWGLPSYYLAGVNSTVHSVEPGALTRHRTDAFCLGLADLPAGDMMLRQRNGRFAPVVQLHGDLWGHLTGAGTFELGARMIWVLGDGYRDAIRRYQRELVDAGVISTKSWSPEKTATATASQYNTWGAQIAAGQASHHFDEEGLLAIHDRFVSSGLRAEMFVIDDKWEGRYGLLEHSAERFPQFDRFLRRLRENGQRIGLWAAFLRCDDPSLLGLTHSHMLRGTDGGPVVLGSPGEQYYLLDVTQPEVQRVLRERITGFVERYRPDLVKFDFGYEVPALSRCAPADLAYAGERLLRFGLDLIVGALRAANPDIVVMYYSLSPLFAEHIDLHGLDDMWMNAGEYHLEANRRLFFSGILGELGMPSYGSGGYDWTHITDIWFDSVVFGSLGSLGSFTGDLSDSTLTDRHVAKFNGLSRLARRQVHFAVDPVGAAGLGPVSAARSSSWVRRENGEITLVALRVAGLAGAPGVSAVADLVTTDVDVVLASLEGTTGVVAASHLGLVPYGDGTVVLARSSAAAVTVREHTLDGGSVESVYQVPDGLLQLPVREDIDGSPVTWLELTV